MIIVIYTLNNFTIGVSFGNNSATINEPLLLSRGRAILPGFSTVTAPITSSAIWV